MTIAVAARAFVVGSSIEAATLKRRRNDFLSHGARGNTQAMPLRERRLLTLASMSELRAEIERLDVARREGRLEPTGSWSLDQCCQHLGRWIEFSIDGFPFRYPWRYRLLGRLVRLVSWRWLVSLAMRPGFVNPPSVQPVEPNSEIIPGEGTAYLLQQLSRIEAGQRMTQPSPVEGAISHEQWCYFHLRHAELHLSFQRAGTQ
jgi:hypothetical protein